MAQWGAGWMASGSTPDQAEQLLAQIHTYMEEAGRSPDNFGLDLWISVNKDGPDQWPALIERWRGIGATHIAINTMSAGYNTVDQHLDTVRRFKDVVDGL
jgi:hypothetical protein